MKDRQLRRPPPKSEGRPRFRRRPSYLDGGKPNSVVDDHSSKRHTRGLNRTGCPSSVLSCTAWGFSCRPAYAERGELLPRLFTLTCAFFQRTGGVFSATLSVNVRFRERRPRILRGMLPYGVRTFLQ